MAEKASPRIAVAYPYRGTLQMGHNATSFGSFAKGDDVVDDTEPLCSLLRRFAFGTERAGAARVRWRSRGLAKRSWK